MPDTTDPDYNAAAAEFIEEAERIAALGLPQLPDDPVQAAAMRASGYDVLAGCTAVNDDGTAAVWLAGDDHGSSPIGVRAEILAAAVGTDVAALPGTRFIVTLQETPENGRTLSGIRPLPA